MHRFADAVCQNFHPMFDNPRPQVARIVTNWLDTERVEILAWPAQSTDLDRIEHVLHMLRGRIMDNVENVVQLREVLKAESAISTQGDIYQLTFSINNVSMAVVNKSGCHTWYSFLFNIFGTICIVLTKTVLIAEYIYF